MDNTEFGQGADALPRESAKSGTNWGQNVAKSEVQRFLQGVQSRPTENCQGRSC
jgi:hypothetical protein